MLLQPSATALARPPVASESIYSQWESTAAPIISTTVAGVGALSACMVYRAATAHLSHVPKLTSGYPTADDEEDDSGVVLRRRLCLRSQFGEERACRINRWAFVRIRRGDPIRQ